MYLYVCPSVCAAQTCLKHSIFIFLARKTLKEKSAFAVLLEPKILRLVYFVFVLHLIHLCPGYTPTVNLPIL